jgi:hypothetical protein
MVWFQVVLVVSGPPIGVCEVCTDVPFHGNSSDIIFSLLRLPCSLQVCRKNRPLLLQQFIAGVIDIGQK